VIELKVKPRRPNLGTEVRLFGSGFPAGSVDESGVRHDGYVRVTISYADRGEGTKALVAAEGHPNPVYQPGDLDFTVRAERPGKAVVQVWDWSGMHVLATTTFTVVE